MLVQEGSIHLVNNQYQESTVILILLPQVFRESVVIFGHVCIQEASLHHMVETICMRELWGVGGGGGRERVGCQSLNLIHKQSKSIKINANHRSVKGGLDNMITEFGKNS